LLVNQNDLKYGCHNSSYFYDSAINSYKFLDVVYSFIRKANGLPQGSLDNQLLWRKKAMGLLRTAAVVKVASNRGAKKEAEKQEKEKAAEASKK
jgi:hypothetical protein